MVIDNTKKGYDEYKECDKELSELNEKKETLVTELEISEIDKAIKNIIRVFANKHMGQFFCSFEVIFKQKYRNNAIS